MIYKNVSVKRVISKVFSDFDLKEGDHRISDMIEWSGEALEKIGAFPYFEVKVTGKDNVPILEVSNYQAKLPNDFHNLLQVSYSNSESGPFYPMRYATGNMEYSSQLNTDISSSSSTTDAETVALESDLTTLAMDIYDLEYSAALTKLNDEPGTKSMLTALLDKKSNLNETSLTTDYIYVIQNGWIKTNIRSGYLMISYQAIPTDLEGYPMIPDDASFLEALYWYIAVKLLYPQWRDGRIRDLVYFDARQSWNYYCKQAYGKAMMLNQDQLESFKNSWLRLVDEINEHDTFFSNLGQEQVIYNANNN